LTALAVRRLIVGRHFSFRFRNTEVHMLILGRRSGERILVGDDIEIVITSVRKGHVRVGIKAPPEVAINRPESMGAKKKAIPPGGDMASLG
jgi:carbon storage regulator